MLGLVTGCSDSDPAATLGDQSATVDPHSPPTHVVWTSFAGVAVPCAEQGPTDCYATAPTGYNHTGAGAALAAISATIRMSVAPDTSVATIVGQLVVPDAARDTWSVQRQRLSITAPVDKAKAPTVIGYTVDAYTPQRATITIVEREHDKSLTAITTDMVWSAAGDWLRQLPAAGDTANRVRALSAPPPGMVALPAPPT